MAHFSKYIRPNAQVIGLESTDKELQVTAAKNPDGTIAVIVFNEGKKEKNFKVRLGTKETSIRINAQALQTIVIASTI